MNAASQVVAVGQVWQTSTGNVWVVLGMLPGDRVRVKLVGSGGEFVWHVGSLTGDGVRIG